MVPLTLKERVQASDVVVEGEVIAQESFWDTKHQNIYTSSTIKVYKSFKGDAQQAQLEVITEGGTVGFQKHVFSTALQLRPGQHGVFFLTKQKLLERTPASTGLSTTPYGSQQGLIRYDITNRTARSVFDSYDSIQQLYESIAKETGQNAQTITENLKLANRPAVEKSQQSQNAPLAPVISSFSPTVASGGTRTLLTINGSGFGNRRGNGFVEFQNADDGGQTNVKPLPYEYISWSNTRIELYIPSITLDEGTAGSGPIRVTANDGTVAISPQPIVLEFAYSNVSFNNRTFQPSLINQNGTGGYTIHFSESMNNRQAAKDGFIRAMNSWIAVSEVNWQIGENTSIEKAVEDETTVVRFAPGSTVGEGVLARTISRYNGCPTSNDTLFFLSEFDMEINSNINWQYGPAGPGARQFDFETVMLHELGHAHQLSHVNLERAVMLYAIESAQLFRTLSSLDIEGANVVMANVIGANPCRIQPMIPKPASLHIFKVYPNPFTDADANQLRLSYIVQSATDLNVKLYDTAGKLIRVFNLRVTEDNIPTTVDLSGIAAGMYILKWQDSARNGQQRILKL
ncbi:hypothetical protein GCM10028895_32690 [Pontibacter rugosus]